MPDTTRIIGIDPGTRICGYGVVELNNGSILHIESGCVKTKAAAPLEEKLRTIYERIDGIIALTKPHCMSIEGAFYSKNARSAIRLGEARGVALLCAGIHGIPVSEYTPSEVKLALTGSGRADKTQVRKMISILIGVDTPGAEDVSDALAIAICHVNRAMMGVLPGGAVGKARSRRRRRMRLDDLPLDR